MKRLSVINVHKCIRYALRYVLDLCAIYIRRRLWKAASLTVRLNPCALSHRVSTFFHIWFSQNQIFQYPLLISISMEFRLTRVSHSLRKHD